MVVKSIFSFFGPPGAGKGTLAQNCAELLDFEILSVGNLCRQQILLKTDIGKRVKKFLDDSHLIADELIAHMVNDWVLSKIQIKDVLILDGFPRTKQQVELFKSFLNRFLPEIKFVVFNFDISKEISFKRCLQRLTCTNIDCFVSSSNYLSTNNKMRCGFCGSMLKKRKDDYFSNLSVRLDKFFKHKDKLLNFYKEIGQLVEFLDIDEKTTIEVFDYFVKKCVIKDKKTTGLLK